MRRLPHTDAALRPALRLPVQTPRTAEDPCRELEEVVDRLARLVLGAHALAERRPPSPTGDDELGRRLRAGVALGRRALDAAVQLEIVRTSGRPAAPG